MQSLGRNVAQNELTRRHSLPAIGRQVALSGGKTEEPDMPQNALRCLLALVLLGVPSRGQDLPRGADKQKKQTSEEFLFEVQPRVIAPGEAAVLRWSIKGATTVVIEEASTSNSQLHKIGTFGGSGSLQVWPKEDTTYVVSCEGPTTSCASVSIRARPKPR